ncbi:MAG: MBL fold metallo-hydrolase [Pseudomonadota bacterium]
MLQIQQFSYATDNLGYLIFGPRTAIAVDGGAVKEMLAFIREHDLRLACITNTHCHGDHTPGNDALIQETGASYVSPEMSAEKGFMAIDGEIIRVHPTPGHSSDSVVFQVGGMLLTGDTLFNGTIGNCFSGDLKAFFQSIRLLMAFPAETLIYAGHDYVKESMAVAKGLEPDNGDITTYLNRYSPDHVCSTLGEELRVNPYLRFNSPSIIRFLKSKGLRVETEYERWESLLSVT